MVFNITNYPGEYAMHVKTEKEAKSFCKYLAATGRTWCDGDSYSNNTCYTFFKDDTIYLFNKGLFGQLSVCKEKNLYTVLEWSDFDWQNEENPEDIIDKLYNIVLELDARESSGNAITEFSEFSWDNLCDLGIDLFNQLKDI